MSMRVSRISDNAGETIVQWPHAMVSGSDADIDVGPPLAQLLVDLDIKGTRSDQVEAGKASRAFIGAPDSISIIEAGATAASKGWATFLALVGGGAVFWAKVSDFWADSEDVQGPLVIGVAIVVAACLVGCALIMYGDVTARGRGAAAQYAARAEVAAAFLRSAPRPPTVAQDEDPNAAHLARDLQERAVAVALVEALSRGNGAD